MLLHWIKPRHNAAHEWMHTRHGGKPPGSQYAASPREYPSRIPRLGYPGHDTVTRVKTVGVWSIYFGNILLAKPNERACIIRE